LAVAAAVLMGCSCGSSSAPGEPENVLLITLDTTRPDFFGAWGMPGNPTPHYDALAEDGVRFATAVSASAVTPVSHASILTGRTPYGHGLRVLAGQGGFRLPESVPTLASVLKERGYATAAFHSAFPVSSVFGFERGFDEFQDVLGKGMSMSEEGEARWDVTDAQRSSVDTNALVLDFLGRTEEPFFVWIHYWDPHDPFLIPPDDFLAARGVPRGPDGWELNSRECYGAEVSWLDQQFGQLVSLLKERDLYDSTLVAVVADHGEGLQDGVERHGWFAHRILYQEQIHVPLILRVPGAATGRTVDRMVRSIDIFPTVLDYLDVAPPGEVEGRSLKALIEGREDEPRIAYADQINLWDANAKMLERRPQADFLHVLMDDRYKLIYRPSFPRQSELYDYRADPGELENLFARPEHRERVVEMLVELASREEAFVLEPFTAADGSGGMTARHLQTLTALGYAGGESGEAPDATDMWEFRCPRDGSVFAERGACPACGTPGLPVRKAP